MKSTVLTEDESKYDSKGLWGNFKGINEEPFETKTDQIMAFGGMPKKNLPISSSSDCR
jgi:hypothetical protein